MSILPYNCVITLARFRTTNNLAPVNVMRFSSLDREDTVCRLCDLSEIGNKYHYSFQCIYFINKRFESIDDKYSVNLSENNFKITIQYCREYCCWSPPPLYTILDASISPFLLWG